MENSEATVVTSGTDRLERPPESAQDPFRRLPASREFELLLCCAQSLTESERKARIQRHLSEGVDWEALIEAANTHCLLPLLYWRLDESCGPDVPGDVLHRLRDHFIATEWRNRMLLAELQRLLDVFDGQDIVAVPFKGPLLALTVYGHIAHRQFGDLDILVPKADLADARALLVAKGYWQRLPFGAFSQGSSVADDYTPAVYSRAQQRAHTKWHTEDDFISADGLVEVDLHWKPVHCLTPGRGVSQQMWANLQTQRVNSKTIRSFAPDDLILLLCVHGAQEYWGQLKRVVDLDRAVQGGVDWPALVSKARQLHCERMVLLGLLLTHQLLETPLPSALLRRLKTNRTLTRLTEQVYASLINQADRRTGLAQVNALHLKVCDQLTDRLALVWRKVTQPRPADWTRWRLPGPLLGFCAPMRRLAGVVHRYSKLALSSFNRL